MKTFKLLGLLAILFTFAACGDDDAPVTPTIENEFIVDGTSSPLTNGFLVPDFFDQGTDSIFTVLIGSEDLTYNADDVAFESDSNGDVLVFFVQTDNVTSLSDGTYSYFTGASPSATGFSGFLSVDTGIEEAFNAPEIDGGTLTIGTDGTKRTFVFSFTYDGGKAVSGGFSDDLELVEF